MEDRSLRSLRNDLMRQRQEVRNKLVAIISSHFEEYQGMNKALEETEVELATVKAPVVKMRKRAEDLHGEAEGAVNQFKEGLRTLHAIQFQRKLLNNFLDLERKVKWLEGQTCKPDPDEISDGEDEKYESEAPIRNPHRIEYLSFLTAVTLASTEACATYPYGAALIARLEEVHGYLVLAASTVWRENLKRFNEEAGVAETTAACVRAFMYLGEFELCERIFIKKLVDPLLSRGEENILVFLKGLGQVLADRPVRLLISVRSEKVQEDLIARLSVTLLKRAVVFLTDLNFTNIVVPSAFHRNYTATTTFLSDLIKSLQMEALVDKVPELAGFLAKWPIDVYFQILARQITQDFESDVSSKNLIARLDVLTKSYVPALSHRFFKLSLQMIMRYHLFLLERKVETIAEAMIVIREIRDAETQLRACPLLHAKTEFQESMTTACRFGDKYQECIQVMTRDLVAGCDSVLKLTKNISSQFRYTNRPMPTTPSTFIPMTFKDVIDHYAANKDCLDDSEWAAVIANLCAQVAEAHYQLVTELLDILKKTEKRYRDRGAGGAPAAETDEEKIRAQVQLDTQALAKEMAHLPHFEQFQASQLFSRTLALFVDQRSG